MMQIEISEDVARHAARVIAAEARAAIAARGRFLLAVSGGQTPWEMLRLLATEDIPWDALHFFQVDERVAPIGHADRNLTHLRESLAAAPLKSDQIHAMPVEAADLFAAASEYAAQMAKLAGLPPVLDLVHLGLGADGHTASLVPGDSALDIADRDVAVTGAYQGRVRMTLTYPLLNRARRILWLAAGASKAAMVARLRQGDPSIPAGRVRQDRALLVVDAAAAGTLTYSRW